MRASGWIFAYLASFVGFIGGLYFFVANSEPAGSVLLLGTSLLASMISTYLLVRTNNVPPPPEDRTDADISEGAGVVGYFSGASLWPFAVGVASMIAAIGMAVSGTALAFGLVTVVLASTMLVVEGWRRS